MDRHYRALELDKILKMLAAEASCEDSAQLALEIAPSASPEEVKGMLAQTGDAHMLIARFGSPSFGGLVNVTSSLRRAGAGGVLSAHELLAVAQVLRVFDAITQWRGHCEGVRCSLDGYFNALSPNKFLENKISGAIINEEEISDNASPALYDIRRKMRQVSSKIREQLDKIIHSASYQKFLQEPIVTIRSGRFVVPVKAEYKNEVQGLVHDTSSSGATVFIEPASSVQANNELRLLTARERDEIERILAELSALAGEFADSIIDSFNIAVRLDLIFAKAGLAYKMRASCPKVGEDGRIVLKRARHPLIDAKAVVPADISLGVDFDTLVITGPNTGGKTVALKTLGLLTLMTMCGMMIPADEGSQVSVFDRVLADIGDEQSIEQSLSTFSSHMTNIISIIDKTDDKTLVLLDELGAGTDPVEGAALATAVLESLRGRGAKIAATTHYAELKMYALETAGVENGACEFDVATLRPTYRLLLGVTGRSNAFAISQRLGLPREIIERARELVSSEHTHFEQVMDTLESSRQSLESSLAEAETLRREAKEAKLRASQLQQELEREKERALDRAAAEARQIVDRARQQANALLNELESIKKEQGSAAEKFSRAKAFSRSTLNAMEEAVYPEGERTNENYVLPRPLRVGDSVLIFDIDKKGTVVELPDSSGNVTVQAGIIKTRVPAGNLRLIEEEKVSVKRAPAVTKNLADRSKESKTEIDIRGKAIDEAMPELDSFIDGAQLLGVGQVTVIHGKGTGALRAAVHKYLRGHRAVDSFRLGVFGEGETGVTIVRLK